MPSQRIPIPSQVKSNARLGLHLVEQFGRGGTSVGHATARYLYSSSTVSEEKLRHIAAYFPRHAGDNLHQTNPPSNGYIAWLLWGGDAGREWAEREIAKIERSNRDRETQAKKRRR